MQGQTVGVLVITQLMKAKNLNPWLENLNIFIAHQRRATCFKKKKALKDSWFDKLKIW